MAIYIYVYDYEVLHCSLLSNLFEYTPRIRVPFFILLISDFDHIYNPVSFTNNHLW